MIYSNAPPGLFLDLVQSCFSKVSRAECEEGPLFEEQETEGQRQLHSLLLQQLHTHVDIQRCVSKRQCFAPAALYCPFGEQAAGVRSLTQFQALQDGEQELSALRDLGLTHDEIQLWRSRDHETDKVQGVLVDPGARQQRLEQIREKMAARSELLSRPQRFNSSRALTRREMEIERALYQGNERQGFLSALYHRDVTDPDQQVSTSSRSIDSVYREVLEEDRLSTLKRNKNEEKLKEQTETETDQSRTPEQSQTERIDQSEEPEPRDGQSEESRREEPLQSAPVTSIDLKQPISSLRAASHVPVTVRGDVEVISEEDILSTRDSDETIRNIPRFKNYQPGKPSKVLCVKNLSAQATVAQLVALFSRFEQSGGGGGVVYKLLTGRLKGQAFITLPDVEAAQKALELIHGYRLLGKPLVVEFGREKHDSTQLQNHERD
ncbi:RNA-binding protein 41 isoform X2 [Boleophthalmus pectinirostris]|uniref:RNA-binding protein 41 isoform X2 n=1 Tax=Boleophthalmus pectinirostris TaxID=150288 RepID=UPI0024303CB7|nr:RNA-binding protein 41 isoform X2 [Boleophthalmus pectinirostris]